MAGTRSAYLGCLLGLAVGDAMGYPVDKLRWDQIREDYGPQGLLGYAPGGDCAEITSHTQLAAFTLNGLLLAMNQEARGGRRSDLIRYIALSHREWGHTQSRSGLRRTYCWVSGVPELCRRRCCDIRMPDALAMERMGTPEKPINSLEGPGSLTAAVTVGLYANARKLDALTRDRLGAETVALTCGSPLAYFSGTIAANLTDNILEDPKAPFDALVERAIHAAEAASDQACEVTDLLRHAMDLAAAGGSHRMNMEQLQCRTAPQVLAGAVYALLTCGGDFDTALITAVNHSGRSAAVAALAGAMMGAKLGVTALPRFYLENLDVGNVLLELTRDLVSGCPAGRDLDWERKYLQGER